MRHVGRWLAPQPGIKPTPPELEGEVLTPGPPGKSLSFFYVVQVLVGHITTQQQTLFPIFASKHGKFSPTKYDQK